MDRRETAFDGNVAHVSLRGRVDAARFTAGACRRVCQPVAPLHDAPDPSDGRRTRELVLHERFRVLDITEGWAFGFAVRDGYVGYLRCTRLAPSDPHPMSHVVAVRQSYLAATPALKAGDPVEPVSFGTEVLVQATHENGRWAEVTRLSGGAEEAQTRYVPTMHLRPLDRPEVDPVAVAERFLGTPYLWGGNSGFGIDCSGLVQAAHLACAIGCPGDSDQQAARLGDLLDPADPVQRGDLFFWKGHVGLARDPETLIHATARPMAVVTEPLAQAIDRIAAQGDGPVTSRRRLASR